MVKVKVVKAKKFVGRKKNSSGKEYRYEYYTLPLLLYVPKATVEDYGDEFEIIHDEDNHTWIIRPRRYGHN